MGAGCSNRPATVSRKTSEQKLNKKSSISTNKRINNHVSLLSGSSKYQTYKYRNEIEAENNLIMFTQMDNYLNDFYVLDEDNKATTYSNIYKSKGIAVGYCKGFKLDVYNQDKFFLLLDGQMEIYCVVDGHGPYGNIIAQVIQDYIFQTFPKMVQDVRFDLEFEKFIRNEFDKLNEYIHKGEAIKKQEEYDAFLSGASVTVIIKKEDTIYCANVGNVSAFLLSSDRDHSYKYKIIGLTLDDSDFTADSLLSNLPYLTSKTNSFDNNKTIQQNNKEIIDYKESQFNIHTNFDIKEELRRIYESGGEIRKLAGEEKSRIFVKGKYFPGLISTRSIGDQIGASIGIISTPHVSKINFDDGIYYLVITTDGIRNVLKAENIISIIENSDVFCKIFINKIILVPVESITNIIEAAKLEYKKSSYCPDMTIVLRTFNKYI